MYSGNDRLQQLQEEKQREAEILVEGNIDAPEWGSSSVKQRKTVLAIRLPRSTILTASCIDKIPPFKWPSKSNENVPRD